jgi:TolA-binding protein
MLIFPDRQDIDLYYRWGSATYAGLMLTSGFLLCFLLPPGLRAALNLRIAPLRASLTPAVSRRRLVMLGGSMAVVAVALLTTSRTASNVVFSQGLAAFQAEDFPRAEALFKAAADENPRSSAGVQSVLYLGLSYYKAERWQDAADAFGAVADRFPENPGAPEALYHVGMSYQRAGKAGADEYFRQTIRRYPNTSWARHARERLKETGAQ